MRRPSPFHLFPIAAALLAAAGPTACRSAGGGAARPVAVSPTEAGAAAPTAVSPQDVAAIARARADSALHLYTPADVQFMTAMIGHHAQAITMSKMAPTHGASASVRTLAARIINAQQDEIGTMQQWLRDRHQPVPAVSTAMDMPEMAGNSMADHAGHDMGHAMMPGMLTAAQMRQLDQARGADFDRLFLAFMIQHHRGAVSMVQTLFGSYGAGQDEAVFKFASDVNVDQTTEIARMERMRAALLFGATAPGATGPGATAPR